MFVHRIGLALVIHWQHSFVHMLFILSRRQHCWQEVDRLVCAELPDQTVHPRLFDIVTSCQMHGVCGPVVRVSRTVVDPRTLLSRSVVRRQWVMIHTHFIASSRHRSPEDGGKTFKPALRPTAIYSTPSRIGTPRSLIILMTS